MMNYELIVAVILCISLLLFMIVKLKFHPFIALLSSSIILGIFSDLDSDQIISNIQTGMANTLGFIAVVVGLGALLGAILEHSGGAIVITKYMIKKLGINQAPLAMAFSGFLIAIPVFFDVAFIILIPIIYALQKQTGKSLLLFAIPLLAGLATTHAFIPPTPGPIAVAQIIGANLGWVIHIGFIVGIPTVMISGVLFGKFISKRIFISAPPSTDKVDHNSKNSMPSVSIILFIILLPLILILINTIVQYELISINNGIVKSSIQLIGHPFCALLIANILAWYILGIKQGFTKTQLLDISRKSLIPAGSIILITGAGGVLKEFLVSTGIGEMIAKSLNESGFSILLFSYLVAFLIRIFQGSSTVAMITAASLVSPLIISTTSNLDLACIVISIAAGASATSHVNDSGFWLVNQYLRTSEKETFYSWTGMTTILSLSGFIIVTIINYLLG